MPKTVLAEIDVKQVDDLTYGELAALHASASALNVDGPYVFVVYDDNLYIGEYKDETLAFYQVITARTHYHLVDELSCSEDDRKTMLDLLDHGVVNKAPFRIGKSQ